MSESEDGGHFGRWVRDDYGLPAYAYTCDHAEDPKARTPTSWGDSRDHFHQMGNDRITLTAHNQGYVQVLDGNRGFQWVSLFDEARGGLGGGLCHVVLPGDTWSDSFGLHTKERLFGMGYYRRVSQKDSLRLTHTIFVPYGDDPVALSVLDLDCIGTEDVHGAIYDVWDCFAWPLLLSLVVTHRGRKRYGRKPWLQWLGNGIRWGGQFMGLDTDGKRDRFRKRFVFVKEPIHHGVLVRSVYRGRPKRAPEKPCGRNFYPAPLFLSLLTEVPGAIRARKREVFPDGEFLLEEEDNDEGPFGDPCLTVGSVFRIPSGESHRIVSLFGMASSPAASRLIEKYHDVANEEDPMALHARQWQRSVVRIQVEGEDWLSREVQWHSYYIRSASHLDVFSGCHKLPQGSIYLFGHGIDGAVRDFMFFLYPLLFLSPHLAEEFLTYTLKLMRPSGQWPYAVYGFGKTFGALIHDSPSDLGLFVLWGLAEYMYLTGDREILNKWLPYWGRTAEGCTVLERVKRCLKSLLVKDVGLGPHGLLRVHTGDWSDGISLMVRSRRKFVKKGESVFNSAMAVYVFQRLLPLLRETIPDWAEQVEKALESLTSACLACWNGRWFLRGWDGANEAIGDRELFLEHHVWLLLSGIVPEEQARALMKVIQKKLDLPSKVGAYVLHPPVRTRLGILPEGWDVNGGVWHAINGLLTWAYSLYDPCFAWQSLWKNSLACRARQYPDIWYGIWSGPDSYVADYAEGAGQAFYHLPTPMTDWPIMNLNCHSGHLGSLLRLAGVVGTHDGLLVHPRIPRKSFDLRTPLVDLSFTNSDLRLNYRPLVPRDSVLRFICPSSWEDIGEVWIEDRQVPYQLERKQEGIQVTVRGGPSEGLSVRLVRRQE